MALNVTYAPSPTVWQTSPPVGIYHTDAFSPPRLSEPITLSQTMSKVQNFVAIIQSRHEAGSLDPLIEVLRIIGREEIPQVKQALRKNEGYIHRLFSSESWTEWLQDKTALGSLSYTFADYVDGSIRKQTILQSCDREVVLKANREARRLLSALHESRDPIHHEANKSPGFFHRMEEAFIEIDRKISSLFSFLPTASAEEIHYDEERKPKGAALIQTMPDFFTRKCPSMFSREWEFRWIATCFTEGTIACINNVVNSVFFLSCRDTILQELEKDLLHFLSVQASRKRRFSLIPDCLSDPCADIDQSQVHPREKQAGNLIHSRENITNWLKSLVMPPEWTNVQEFLRFRKGDPREKLLYLSAVYDHNNALNPDHIAGILSQLSQKYDIRYMVVESPKQLCEAVEISKKVGKLANLVIEAHGNPHGIKIGEVGGGDDWLLESMDHAKCFSGVHPSGKIVLFSCSTGSKKTPSRHSLDNIAQKIADDAKRVVVAAKGSVYGSHTSLLSADTAMLFHQESILYTFVPFYNKNLFTLFKPNYPECSGRKLLHRLLPYFDQIWRNQGALAAEEIQKNLISKSLASDSETTEMNTLAAGCLNLDQRFFGRLQSQGHVENIREVCLNIKGPIVDSVRGQHLAFCEDDPREKLLCLVASWDGNGALQPHWISGVMGAFADKFDLKYATVNSMDEICAEVNTAAEFGELANLVIVAHGSPLEGIVIGTTAVPTGNGGKDRVERITNESDFRCLSKVKKDGTIVLSGGSVGQNGLSVDNLAQHVADVSQRTVLAPTCHIYPKKISVTSVEPLILSHPQHSSINSWWYSCPENNGNIFKTFEPKQQK